MQLIGLNTGLYNTSQKFSLLTTCCRQASNAQTMSAAFDMHGFVDASNPSRVLHRTKFQPLMPKLDLIQGAAQDYTHVNE